MSIFNSEKNTTLFHSFYLKEMIEKQIYVITGGPGFGKTLLVEELKQAGYQCSGEFARDLILAQQASGGDILPWKNAKLFQQNILQKRIAFFDSVASGSIAFADRGIPDQLAFARYKGFGTPEILNECSLKYRYAPHVFVTPPWPEIYTNDTIRSETFEEALRIHEFIVETYTSLDYQLIELPLLPVKKRLEYLLQTLTSLENKVNKQTG
jgi:predicted ATPase